MANDDELKTQIIDSLHKIICTATSTAGDSRVANNDYFKRRVLGFRAEQEFRVFIDSDDDVEYFDGGQFIFKTLTGREGDKNKFIYTTISFDSPERYIDIYKTFSVWEDIHDMYFLKIVDNQDWETTKLEVRDISGGNLREADIIEPRVEFYVFDKNSNTFKKSEEQSFGLILNNFGIRERAVPKYPLRERAQFDYFGEYNLKALKSIYVNRYLLDVILRKAQGRLILDTDGFVIVKERLVLVEIKEKSPITGNPVSDKEKWEFGWDTRRILWYLYLSHKIKIDVLYCVREIDDREHRNFVGWRAIMIDEFLSGNSWSSGRAGGGGEDTTLSPYLLFSNLQDLLKSLSS